MPRPQLPPFRLQHRAGFVFALEWPFRGRWDFHLGCRAGGVWWRGGGKPAESVPLLCACPAWFWLLAVYFGIFRCGPLSRRPLAGGPSGLAAGRKHCARSHGPASLRLPPMPPAVAPGMLPARTGAHAQQGHQHQEDVLIPIVVLFSTPGGPRQLSRARIRTNGAGDQNRVGPARSCRVIIAPAVA